MKRWGSLILQSDSCGSIGRHRHLLMALINRSRRPVSPTKDFIMGKAGHQNRTEDAPG